MGTALITGITGQDGAYLAQFLLNKGYRVVGAFRRASTVNTTRLDALDITESVELVPFDLTDHGNMRRVIEEAAPDEAYNLGSGLGFSVRDIFELVHRESGVEVELNIEPSRVRATDIPYLVADLRKTRGELGWEAEIPLETTIRDMLNTAQDSLKASGKTSSP